MVVPALKPKDRSPIAAADELEELATQSANAPESEACSSLLAVATAADFNRFLPLNGKKL
ncbi:unnamed protein product [Withania somnifera]